MDYILVLVMIFNSGNGGMGGIEHVKLKDLESCSRIGSAWVDSMKKQRRLVRDDEFLFACIPISETKSPQ